MGNSIPQSSYFVIKWQSYELCIIFVPNIATNMNTILLSLLAISVVPLFAKSAINETTGRVSDTLIHGKPVLISKQFSFTEGPAVDKYGNVYFTDQPNNKIWKYSTDGKLSIFMDTCGRSNGLYFDQKGNLIACADEHDQLWSISPDKEVTILVKNFQGARLNGPNDVWVAPNGGIYFTDPYYQRDYWERTTPDPAIHDEYLYYLAPGNSKPVIVDKDFVKPNGVVGSHDGKHLFAADIDAGKIYKYDIAPDGSLENKTTLIVNHKCDGLTIDRKGNLYLSGKGITIYNPKGEKIGHIPIPEPWTANVCFGGKNRDQLFITASKAVYIVRMEGVRGD